MTFEQAVAICLKAGRNAEWARENYLTVRWALNIIEQITLTAPKHPAEGVYERD